MKHKVDLSLCSTRFTVEVEGKTPEEIRENITDLIRNKIHEVWEIYVYEHEGLLRDTVDNFLVVREQDKFVLEQSKSFMNPPRFAET